MTAGDGGPGSAIEPTPVPVPPAPAADPASTRPRRRRRGWIVALVVVAVLAVVGVVGFFVADAWAQGYAREVVRERVLAVLGLPADAAVEVDLGGGSIILQALAGRIDEVDVAVPEATVGSLSGAVAFHAEGVPLAETEPVDVLRIRFAVPEAELQAIAGNLSGLELDEIALEGEEIVVATQVSVLGFPIDLGLALAPSAADGQLVFTPTKVTVAGRTFSAASILADPLLGAIAGKLLDQRSVCLASSLPHALELSSARVADGRLELGFTGDGATLGGPELQTPGTCTGA